MRGEHVHRRAQGRGGGGGGEGGEDGEKTGIGAVSPAACLPLQCPPNIMMLSCDVSGGGR